MAKLTYYCDNTGNLVCRPYTPHNLQAMAEALKIHVSFFRAANVHSIEALTCAHYKIPLSRFQEIYKQCTHVTTNELYLISKKQSIYDR